MARFWQDLYDLINTKERRLRYGKSDYSCYKTIDKKYGNIKVVEQVNLNVKKGCIYGILGRNGAGKTTIMKMILGLISISSGEIEILENS